MEEIPKREGKSGGGGVGRRMERDVKVSVRKTDLFIQTKHAHHSPSLTLDLGLGGGDCGG